MKALLLALLLPLPAGAGPLSDLLMAPGVVGVDVAGPVLVYDETRSVPAGSALRPAGAGRLTLAAVDGPDGRRLALSQAGDGSERPVASFPAGSANPVLLYFLEATVRDVSGATGGSPFYIRNRIREAMAAAGVGEGGDPRAVVIAPFAADPNRARMGGFADLTLLVRFEADQPGRLLELSADTAAGAGGYHHRLTLSAED